MQEVLTIHQFIRCLTDTNEKLESDNKTLQQLLEAKDKAEKRRREKSYAEAVSSKSAEFDPDDWIPKYDPKTKPIIIGDSDSSDSSSDAEWTDAETTRRLKRKTKKEERRRSPNEKDNEKPKERDTHSRKRESNDGRKPKGNISFRRLADAEKTHERSAVKYCHFYNNSIKGCKNDKCRFTHEDAPKCNFKDNCRYMREFGRCNFYHENMTPFLGTGSPAWKSPWNQSHRQEGGGWRRSASQWSPWGRQQMRRGRN